MIADLTVPSSVPTPRRRDELRELIGSLLVTTAGIIILHWFHDVERLGGALVALGVVASLLSLAALRAAAARPTGPGGPAGSTPRRP